MVSEIDRTRKQVGNTGEADAVRFLRSQGYEVIGQNVRPLPGLARGEIDIIAWDGLVLCFVEVKSRRSQALPPDLGVNPAKRKKLIALAEAYLCAEQIEPETCRFDVVSVWSDPALPTPMLLLHKDAFAVQ